MAEKLGYLGCAPLEVKKRKEWEDVRDVKNKQAHFSKLAG
jgi:hypothetical protein